jgi:MFS family permease
MSEAQEVYKPTTMNRVWPWLMVIGFGFLNAFTMQLIFSNFGIFVRPITTELDFPVASFSFTMTISILSMTVSIPIMGRLILRVPTQILMSIALLVCLGAWAANSLMTEVWQWWLTGVLIGFGGAFVFAQEMPIILGNWFVKNQGTAIGATYFVSAGLAAVMAIVGAMIIESMGWRSAYQILALIGLIFTLPWTLFVIRFKPEEKNMKPIGYDPNAPSIEVGSENAKGVTQKKAMTYPVFWILFLLGGVLTLLGSGFGSQLANAAVTWGYDAVFGASLVSTIALYRYLSPLAGLVADKVGAINALFIWLGLITIGFLGFIFLSGTGPLLYFFVILFAGYSTTQNTYMPLITRELFGDKDYSRIFSIIAAGFSVIGAFGSTIVGWLYDTGGQDYTVSFFFGIGICIVSALMLLAVRMMKKSVVWDD